MSVALQQSILKADKLNSVKSHEWSPEISFLLLKFQHFVAFQRYLAILQLVYVANRDGEQV